MSNSQNKLPQDYTLLPSGYQLSLALDFEIMISKNDSVRLRNEILNGLNYSRLIGSYSLLGRKPEVHPIVMFKILVHAYMNCIYSSRDIVSACKRLVSRKF